MSAVACIRSLRKGMVISMSETCDHQCSSCAKSCEERQPGEGNRQVKKVIGIVSGKGGVGKSLVTSLLACAMKKQGKNVAILDADITGPSIPKAFGMKEKANMKGEELCPVVTKNGIKVMSLNLLVEHETDPVIWRGPILANSVLQFWTEVNWGNVDVMFVDMPPGTGDVPLTVFQSLPLAGIVVVTSPQDLVSMIVEKAVNMASQMNIPILGLVENMSYLECPDCGKKISVFGESQVEKTAEKYGIEKYARIPILPELAKACDEGRIETIDGNWIEQLLN